MTEKEYFEQRVDDQINWYDKKSGWNKKLFMRFKVIEIVLALTIPFLTGYITTETVGIKMLIGLLSVVVAGAASIITLFKFQENWIEYRTVSESLKYEKFLYFAGTGPYRENKSFAEFVVRFESLLSKENSTWASYNTSQKEEARPAKEEVAPASAATKH